MVMLPVKSSNISAAGHDGENLIVRFSNGIDYKYSNVPAEVFTEFMAADSQGKFFHKNIKGKFVGTKVEKEQ